ncbi:MAG: sulfatase-like hydrolase/transferase [Candidatus Omnitrophica bacterium]|nr:sulfatase-like hydrolase/transferase [Candidatus Omnitrophota bacterium]
MHPARIKKIFFICLPFVLLGSGLLLEQIWIFFGSRPGMIRLLTQPPKEISLQNPLWNYRSTLKPSWKISNRPGGMIEYAWEGILDVLPSNPSIQVLSGSQKVRLLTRQEWDEGVEAGYYYKPGEDRLLIANYFFPADHKQFFGGDIPWDSPVLEWESLVISHDSAPMKLNARLDEVWQATAEISADDWTLYRLAAEGIPAGSYTLFLKSTGAYSTADKKIQKQFFIRNFRARNKASIQVRIPDRMPEPTLSYHPLDVIQALMKEPPLPLPEEVWSPWSHYDESPLLVRPLEVNNLVRTCLFLPTPSRWSVAIEPVEISDLVFYPMIRDPVVIGKWGKGHLSVKLLLDESETVLWEGDLDFNDPKTQPVWGDGIRVPLPLQPGQRGRILFSTTPAQGEENQVCPFFLGEPVLVHRNLPGGGGRKQPDVILISIDTLRADAVSLIGGGDTTPFLDHYFGERGVVFTEAEAPSSWTLPSHASLFLSQYVSRHGVRMHYDMISPDTQGLAELFSDHGYETAAFVDREFLNYRFGFSQGFKRYDQEAGHFASILPRCMDWLNRRNRNIPLFLFLHTYDVHDPYTPPEPYRQRYIKEGMFPSTDKLIHPEQQFFPLLGCNIGKLTLPDSDTPYMKGLYLAEVAYMDDLLKDFIEKAESQRLFHDPVVVLLSDHGEAFREHNTWLHGYSLYEEEVRIPILFRFPGDLHAGKKLAGRTTLLDIAPTLFDYLGWQSPLEWQGLSLYPIIQGQERLPEDRELFSEVTQNSRHLFSLHRHKKKWIDTRDDMVWDASGEIKRKVELYNLADDPGEKKNLASQVESATSELDKTSRVLSDMAGDGKGKGSAPAANLDAETIERLQKIGYMHGN